MRTEIFIKVQFFYELRILQNLFLPSMKLLEKNRVGSKLKSRYYKPLTPLERLVACPEADPVKIDEPKRLRKHTDPFELAKRIEQKLERIYQMANHRISPSPRLNPKHHLSLALKKKLSINSIKSLVHS